jgi:hypothetical protein
MGYFVSLYRYKDPTSGATSIGPDHDKPGIEVVVGLHEQTICQTSYSLNVVSYLVLNLMTSML